MSNQLFARDDDGRIRKTRHNLAVLLTLILWFYILVFVGFLIWMGSLLWVWI